MRIAHARRGEMAAIDQTHGGAGPILYKSLYDKEEFQTDWFFPTETHLTGGISCCLDSFHSKRPKVCRLWRMRGGAYSGRPRWGWM